MGATIRLEGEFADGNLAATLVMVWKIFLECLP